MVERLTPVQRIGRALPDGAFRRLKYRQRHGTWPNMRDPRRYSEKMNWRVLNDRREALAWTCDKLAMKAEAARHSNVRIPRTLWVGTDPGDLRAVDLPERWVLKPNNSSGRVHIGSGPVDDAMAASIRVTTDGWLDGREVVRLREWAYSRARPVFLVEEYVGRGEWPPPDYKIFLFDGVPRIFQVITGRFAVKHRTFFTMDWEHTAVTSMEPSEAHLPRPDAFERLIAVASELGRGFDHIRVDLYEADGEVWFGEFTPYSWSGLMPILPVEVDERWGDYWRLPDLR